MTAEPIRIIVRWNRPWYAFWVSKYISFTKETTRPEAFEMAIGVYETFPEAVGVVIAGDGWEQTITHEDWKRVS